jgi:hypothetical protein
MVRIGSLVEESKRNCNKVSPAMGFPSLVRVLSVSMHWNSLNEDSIRIRVEVIDI